MSDVEDLFMRQLLDAFPEFRADLNDELRVYEERKADAFFDPPTADSFLMSLTQAAVNRYLAGGQAEKRQLRALFGYLESRFGSDPEIDELLESRFVQILPAPDGPRAQVLDLLGPKLHAARLRMDRDVRAAIPDSLPRFLDRLAAAVPPVRDKLDEHVRENRGVLPHTFLEDVVAEVNRLYLAGRTEEIMPFLHFLETEFGLDAEVDNLIAVSFVDELPRPGEPGADIERLLGPKLRGELERQRNWPG
jgi:hypothetical protein